MPIQSALGPFTIWVTVVPVHDAEPCAQFALGLLLRPPPPDPFGCALTPGDEVDAEVWCLARGPGLCVPPSVSASATVAAAAARPAPSATAIWRLLKPVRWGGAAAG
jgi:hypothetical protein